MTKPLPYRWNPLEHPETDSMNPEVRGCYHALLDSCWKKNGLPKDLSDLAVICRHLSPSDFEKEVWPKLKELFYVEGGKYHSAFLDKQRRKAKKLSDDQRNRAKSGWENGKRKMPTACQDEAEDIPEKESKILIDHWNEPTARPIDAVSEPEPTQIKSEEFEPMPTVSPIDAEENIVARETESHFDVLDSWQKFSEAYGELGLVDNKDAYRAFELTIQNHFWFKRIVRAAENYLLHMDGEQPLKFMVWLEQWQAWEDPNESLKSL